MKDNRYRPRADKQADHMNEDFYKNTSFTNLDLSDQTISNQEFFSCRFESCNFQGMLADACKFENCEFVSCNLSLLKPRATIFSGVYFINSKCVGVDWSQANNIAFVSSFEECNLTNSSFFGLNLSKMKLADCKASNADFTETDLSAGDLQGTDFDGARFFKTNLSKANLSGAKNYLIDTTNNNITQAIFSYPEVMALLHNFNIIIQ